MLVQREDFKSLKFYYLREGEVIYIIYYLYLKIQNEMQVKPK